MSMHFAPQWVKPIKPTGSALTPTSEVPTPHQQQQHHHQARHNVAGTAAHSAAAPSPSPTTLTAPNAAAHATNSLAAPAVPFPALGHPRSGSPTTATAPNPPLSYSRVTHTPHSPSFPGDTGYFPYNGDSLNGSSGASGPGSSGPVPGPFPFRYSREQILALWDEEKYKERPIELVQMAETGAVIVSKNVVKPVGLRDLTELEKRLLATSVVAPATARRTATHAATHSAHASETPTPTTRRAAPNASKDAASGLGSQANGHARAGFGGFGRGEGGAFGGSGGSSAGGGGGAGGAAKFGGGALAEGRQPGSLGGGFGGVSKRTARRETGEDRPSAAATWRPTRATSGTFEGVLGFGSGGTAAAQSEATEPLSATTTTPSSDAPWKDRSGNDNGSANVNANGINVRSEHTTTTSNGWTSGQKSWRATAVEDKPLDVPIANEHASESVMATPSATPLPERDALIRESTPAPQTPTPTRTSPPQQEREDLGKIEWLYRDPNGQEQGPFTGSQMHEWYSHSYFKDDLPIRRQAETTFQTLAELKTSTGNAVQPFLSPVRPRLPPNLPPNLPISLATLQAAGVPSPVINESFRNLNIQNGVGASPQQTYVPNAPFTPTHYAHPHSAQHQHQQPFSPTPAYLAQQPWGAVPGPQSPVGARLNASYGSIGPGASAYQPYSPITAPIGGPLGGQLGGPIQQRPAEIFSTGLPPQPSPWGAPITPTAWNQTVPVPLPPLPQIPAPVPMHVQAAPINEPYYSIEPVPVVQAPVPAPEAPVSGPESVAEPVPEIEPEFVPEPVEQGEPELVVEDSKDVFETEPEPMAELEVEADPEPVAAIPVKPTPSAWGQKQSPVVKSGTPSRKSSIAVAVAPSTPTQSSKLPPAPASLPPKPVAAVKTDSSPGKATSSVEQASSAGAIAAPKPAPWADKPSTATGPSLREIQQAEARQAEARKQALAEARAASASPAPLVSSSSSDEVVTSISWGLPQQGSKVAVASPVAAAPAAPAWGGGDAAPKKTLKQIQEEEERRKAVQAAQVRAAQNALGAVAAAAQAQKRGYADLAAAVSSPASPSPVVAAGWTTVGSSGKMAPSVPAKPVAAVATPRPVVAAPVKPTVVTSTQKKASGNAVDDAAQPSVEFIRWTKQALAGLTVNMDDFIQMLLQFPVDPPASSRTDVLEIISDSVYANSSTLDGRRFAQEFFTRRKADATRASTVGAKPVQKIASLADVVKTQPKAPAADLGFKVVKAKKGKKA